jgi:hypothetical protein
MVSKRWLELCTYFFGFVQQMFAQERPECKLNGKVTADISVLEVNYVINKKKTKSLR